MASIKSFSPTIFVFCLLAACTPVSGAPAGTNSELPTAEVTLLGSAAPTASVTLSPHPSATPSPTPINAPNLNGESIPVLHLCDRTGPFSGAYTSRIQAVQDQVNVINASGGIFGATLDLQQVNTTGTSDGAQRALASMIRQESEGPLVLICDSQAEVSLSEILNEDEIPSLVPGLFTESGSYLFGLDASPRDHLTFFLDELLSNWAAWRPKDAPEEIRVAIFSWPLDLAGDLTGEDVLQDVDEARLEIVMRAEISATLDANIFDLIYQARDLNVNVIYTNARGLGLAALLNALQDLGLRQRFVVAAPAVGLDTQTYEYLHNSTYGEGLLLTSAWAWWSETEVAGVQELLALQPDASQRDWGYLQMSGAVSVLRRALEDAILDEGFEELSHETVLAALEDLEEFPALAGLYAVDYSSSQRSLGSLRVWRVGVGTWELSLP